MKRRKIKQVNAPPIEAPVEALADFIRALGRMDMLRFRVLLFVARARLEREVGAYCISGVFLDELYPQAGRHEGPVVDDCGIMCELQALPPGSLANEEATTKEGE